MPGVFSWAVTGLFTFGRATVDWLCWDIVEVKGNQKGKVTCYVRERVNKNELF